MSLTAFALAAAVAAAPKRAMIPEDTYRITEISALEVSPAGGVLAYVTELADRKEDSFRHELWLTDASGKSPKRVCRVSDDCNDPKFSPDGKRLAYLSDAAGPAQLWIAKVKDGRGHAITSTHGTIGDFDWSPDGTKLVFEQGEPERRKTSDAPWVITGSQIQHDGEGFVDGGHTHLWIVDASGSAPKPLTSGRYDEGTPRWSPKGDQIAFVSDRNVDPDDTDDSDIWLVGVGGGAPRRLAQSPGPDADPVWSHAGDRVAFVSSLHANDPYRTTHLMTATVEGGDVVDLSAALDNWVSFDDRVGGGSAAARIAWSADDATIVVPFDRRGANWIASIPSRGGAAKELLAGPRLYGLVRVADATQRMYFTVSTPTTLSEIWTANLDGTGARKLLGLNDADWAGLKLVMPQKLQTRNSAGDTIDAWLYPPMDRDPAKRYPMILYIHGGPEEFDGEFFEPGLENQLFPGLGWAVLRVNYRGSTSYGEAFSRALWADWHTREFEDLMAAVDAALAKNPWIDSTRLGIGGWSYGGIMTVWAAEHTDRFKVGVPERFEIDYLSSFGTDEWHTQYVTEFGKPWEHEDRYRAVSPATYVEKIKTPLFLIANERDGNCPPTQAMQLYQRLKLLGVPSELVIYPGESHTMAVPSHYVDRLRRLIDWYGRFLK
jgi:dipeptidyl aminopeptidase/acylaminoacyl peptidase